MDRSRYSTRTSFGDYVERGGRTTDFNQKRARKEFLGVNPYHWERYDATFPLDSSGGILCLCNMLETGHDYQGFDGYPSPNPGSAAHMHTVIRNKLVSKLRSGPVNLGVALGEYRETAEFVVGAMSRVASIYRGIKDLRKFKFEDALHDLGRAVSHGHTRAANAWLEWTYAVKPLIADTAGVVKALSQNNIPVVPVKVIRCNQSFPWSFRAGFRDSGKSYEHMILYGSAKATAGMSYYVDNPFLFTLDQLGMLNPVQVGWELIPLSFVVDWFLDVGSLLGNVVPPQGVTFQAGFTYVKARSSQHIDKQVYYSEDEIYHYSKTGQESYKDRQKLTDFPIYEILKPDLSLSKSRLASAAALMVQRIFGSSR